MCGILGYLYSGESQEMDQARFANALNLLAHRGPDDEGVWQEERLWLGHRRLSVIDLSKDGHQPMSATDGRYVITFNGQIFNYRELRSALEQGGVTFRTQTDTEVVLNMYRHYGVSCLGRLNGFFAFAIYDRLEKELVLVRDRYGIKPLYYTAQTDRFAFASELAPFARLGIRPDVDPSAMALYFQLHYIPAPYTIYRDIRKMEPGHFIKFRLTAEGYGFNQAVERRWYELPAEDQTLNLRYPEACHELFEKMDRAVARRLVSDVPLGTFLSGGIDSSVITALAARHTRELHTFSVGFKDEPHFDETRYARQVAKHCHTRHTVFELTADDLTDALPGMAAAQHEPFADSSALAVYILSRETRKHVTVALGGDGCDELFAGYRKHRAEWMLHKKPGMRVLGKLLSGMLKPLKGSRDSDAGNTIRQIHRFSEGASLSAAERYWRWCSVGSEQEAFALLAGEQRQQLEEEAKTRKHYLTLSLQGNYGLNEVLRNDFRLVLQGDMLAKTDMMSMSHSLEVRLPFLDFEVVDFAFRLPSSFKIDGHHQKKIVRDTFAGLLPAGIFDRPKQGFEIPLRSWFKGSLRSLIIDILDENLIKRQGIFNVKETNRMLRILQGNQEGDMNARIWAMLMFQYWWNNNR